MKYLQTFASYLINHKLDELTHIYLQRAREKQLSLLALFVHFSEKELHALIRQNFLQLLESIQNDTIHEHILSSIELWVENKLPGINRDDPGLHDLILLIGIRKYSLIKVLKDFTQDLDLYTAVIFELNELYDLYREKVYAAYIDNQHQKLQAEKDFIELVMDTTKEGISVVNTDFQVTFWNKALGERTGVKKEDIIGKAIFDFFPRNNTSLEVEAIQKAQKGEKVYLENIPIKTREGFYDMNIVPLKDHSGKIIGSLGVSRDVTDRKLMLDKLHASNEELQQMNHQLENKVVELRKAQKALQSNHKFIESITKISPDFISVFHLRERKNIYTNRSIAVILGYADQETHQGGFTFLSSIIHPEDLVLVNRFIEEYITYTKDIPRTLEYRIKDAQGKYRWIRSTYNVFTKDEQGLPLEVVGVSRDITITKLQQMQLKSSNEELGKALYELKKIEKKLRQTNAELEIRVQDRTKELAASEEELRQLLDRSIELNDALVDREQQMRLITDALPVCISYVDANETYSFVNKTYTSWFKKEKDEIIGSKVKDIIGESAYHTIKDKFKLVLSGKEVRFDGQMAYQTAGNKDVVSSFIPHEVNGKAVGFFSLITDVSSLKTSQKELQKKNEELVRINTDLDNFIYTASHDLKSPIVNLEGIVFALNKTAREKLNTTELKLFEMIDTSIRKLKDTISYLGDVTRIAKNLEDNKKVFSIPQIVEDVKEDIDPLIKEVQPKFIEDYTVENIEFSTANFRSIVYNLLSNALKYRSSERPLIVHIQTYQSENYYVMKVKDNGLGLSELQQNKLFKMFRRMHTHVEGTGIGLYIVKRIIENSGGRIEVQSTEHKGSTFLVYFPMNPQSHSGAGLVEP